MVFRKTRLLLTCAGEISRAAPWPMCLKLACAIAAGLAPAIVAGQTRALIDDLAGHPRQSAVMPLVVLSVLGGVIPVSQYAGRYADSELSRRVSRYGMSRLFSALVGPTGIGELEDPGVQDRIRLALQGVSAGATRMLYGLFGIVQPAITAVGFLFALWGLSPWLTGLVLASAAPAVVAQLKVARRQVDIQSLNSPLLRRQLFYSTLMVDPRAAAEIRLYGLGGLFRGRLLTQLSAAQAQERGVDRFTLRMDGLLSLLTAGISAVALFATVARINSGHATIGDLALLTAALAGLQGSVSGLVTQLGSLAPALATYEVYQDIATGMTPDPGTPAGAEPGSLRLGIEFRDVWFRYGPDHPWVLRGVSFIIPAGRSAALVGVNGAGKSTIVKLLCRLYEPQRGVITWDGADISTLDPAALRKRVGAMLQDFMMYQMSAAENIGVGDVATLDTRDNSSRITAAAEVAGIHAAITALPDGYETMLGRLFTAPPTGQRPANGRPGLPAIPGGVSLSGGQWQRVALARAVLRADADLLILDEPSSGIDAVAELEIHDRLTRLRAGRTSLLISHRLAAIRQADEIIVLDRGQVIESGTHDALMQDGGAYSRMFRAQAAGYQLDATEIAGEPR